MDEKLNAILNDPEKMKAAFAMASQLIGQNAPSSPPQMNGDELAGTLQKMQESGALDSILSNLSGNSNSAPKHETEGGGKNSLAEMLPNILQMLGGSASLDSDRANLLRAIRPYVKESRASSIDRAVNVAGMAKGAKSAIRGFKR